MSSPKTHHRDSNPALQRRRVLQRQSIVFTTIVILCLLPFLVKGLTRSTSLSRLANRKRDEPARLSDTVSVQALGRGNPTVNLSDGHDLLTSYVGPEELQVALAENRAQPLSLASADFDEDGVPDLVSGYGYQGRGIVSLVRGNVDAIYPNAPEAQQRKAVGTFTDAPFLSPARVFAAPIMVDFVGAGDFDGDSHWDLVVASRSSSALYLLSGDGHGEFRTVREIPLPGLVTAMTTGEINRRDGLTDVVVGINGPEGPKLLVFEGPNGALLAQPEAFDLPAPATSLALGQLDSEYAMDLAVAAGNELLVVHGRDRKLSLDEKQRAGVPPAVRSRRRFDTPIRSITLGRFAGDDAESIAVLDDDGGVQLLIQTKTENHSAANIDSWKTSVISSGAWPQAQLVSVHVGSSAPDDLLVVDAANQKLHILNSGTERTTSESAPSRVAASLDVASAPVAVLALRLNGDALSDLALLSSGKTAPAVVPTQPQATFVVTSTNASGAGSLQFAILDANEAPGADLITFNIPGTGPHTISPTAALPTITDPVTIDGTTQPGFQGQPIVVLSGESAGIGAKGLSISAGSSTVRGFRIQGFRANGSASPPGGDAIYLSSGNNLIEGNILGTALARNQAGVFVENGSNNTIGGTGPAARNVIAGVTFGVILSGGATGCNVQGNYLGTDLTGTQVVGQGGNTGVLIGSFWAGGAGTSNTIGGVVAGARNVISGSFTVDYILSTGQGNLIQGNYIGTDVTGANPLPQASSAARGVEIGAFTNTVGGTTPAARNVISAAPGQGVRVVFSTLGADLGAVLVQGNYIGTKADGTGNLGNGEEGVYVNAFGMTAQIGGTTAGAGNVIANSGKSGVEIENFCSVPCGNPTDGKHTVQGNLIGTDASGTVDLGNTQNGVYIRNSAINVIGGLVAGARNVISGNGLSGVLLESAGAAGNVVQGNYIGTTASGLAPLGNDLNGVTTSQAPNNTIGGSVVAARNIISANARHGVSIGIDTNSGATGVTVRNNYIGTDVTGNACLGNQRDGVFVNRGSVSHTIVENLITCNARNGVNIPNFASNDPGIRIEVTNNSIFANASLGIDLGDVGITANDPGDADGGANFQQNFPVLSSSAPIASREMAEEGLSPEAVTINGTLNSTANATFTVHWYFSADSQCGANQASTRPLSFGKVSNITTDGNGNAPFSFPFDFPPGTDGGLINCTATDAQGNTSEFSACFPVGGAPPTPTPTPTPTPGPPPSVQFETANYSAAESIGSRAILITRVGNTSGASSVRYATSDTAGSSNCNARFTQVASSRCDYETTVGTLQFATGEISKAILIPIIDDSYSEANENLTITLSEPQGATLGSPAMTTLLISDDELPGIDGPNPFTQAGYFVRLQYIDFLNREPDTSGFNFWTNEITSCGSNTQCVEIKRVNVSAAFYLSIEFRDTGYLVERIYRAAYGNGTGTSTLGGTHQFSVPVIRFEEFLPDTQEIGRGVVVGQTGWEQVLENNKQAFLTAFVLRTRFTGAFPAGMTPAQYVDALNLNAGGALSTSERNQLVTDLTNGAKTRAQVLRAVAEDADLNTTENNRAFVLMQFYGYLRRNPNDAPDADYTGYDFWLSKLNQFNGNFVQAEMVKAFIQSDEYKHRFGP